VASCCECGDEPSGSFATELVHGVWLKGKLDGLDLFHGPNRSVGYPWSIEKKATLHLCCIVLVTIHFSVELRFVPLTSRNTPLSTDHELILSLCKRP
jgi:hypothetical protein